MFYSESLLSKTGPLARVWLASNLDRKLTKQNVLASNLENNVKDIIGGGQAPMALRLSGQLLLGVVKIYNRKAKYLMDDCNDALLKIKMAFRPGNVDLPSDQSHRANPQALMLPDTITEMDLLAALPDPDDLFREPRAGGVGQDPTLLDFGMSQIMDSQTPARSREQRFLQLDDYDLGLEIGLEPGEQAVRSMSIDEDRSIEIGRRAQSALRDEPSLLEFDDLGLDIGGDTTLRPAMDDTNMIMNDNDEFAINAEIAESNAAGLQRASLRRRDSESPLSSARSSVDRDLEKTFQLDPTNIEEDITEVQAPQRIKRRKVMPMDNETTLHRSDIKKLQEDRSAITTAPTFLPRDPLLLQLMEMQRNGSFVSNLMGDGRMQGWAPELRGILSLEVIRKAGEKKRKRDSGIADVETDVDRLHSPPAPSPGAAEDEGVVIGGTTDDSIPLILDDEPLLHEEELSDEDDDLATPAPNFDITEAPLLHPSQSGPVALGTKKMVHLLREHFAPGHALASKEPPTPSKRVKSSALFTDLCPEQRTSRQDATKMFFELLVLGTKDAIKVEQDTKGLGLPIRVRGKRGLWGDWAEMGTESQLAEQQEDEGAAAITVAA